MIKIKLSDSSKNIVDLFSGSAISNLIGVCLIWCYTAFYSSEVIGLFFVFNALALIVSVITTLQAPVSIVLVDGNNKMWRNFSASIYINFFVALGIGICIALLIYLDVDLINNLIEAYHLWLVPFCAFAMGMVVIFENVLTYFKQFKMISYSRVVKVVIIATSQLGILWFTSCVEGLIIGLLLGQLGAVVFMFYAGQLYRCASFLRLGSGWIKSFYSDNKEILHYNALINIILSISNQLPVVAISFIFGPHTAGVFGLAHRILVIPMGVISQSFSQVFFKEASIRRNNQSMLGLVSLDHALKLFAMLILSAFIIGGAVQFAIGYLDDQWLEASFYVLIMAPWIIGQSIILPFTNLFTVFRIQRQILPLYIIQLVARILVFTLPLILSLSFIPTLTALVSVSLVYYLYYLYFIFKRIRDFDRFVMCDNTVSANNLSPLINGKVKWLMGRKELFLFKSLPWCGNMLVDKGITTVFFQKGIYGPQVGSQFVNNLDEKKKEVELSYRFKFSSDFDFAKGGKLPGLAGGSVVGGGNNHKLQSGWSARFMFMEGGTLCLYLYHPLKKEVYGEQHYLMFNEQLLKVNRDQWIHIRQKISVNDVNKENGRITVWVDNIIALDLNNLVLSCCEEVKVDNILFSCFFGGDDRTYAPKNDCSLSFKDFKIG